MAPKVGPIFSQLDLTLDCFQMWNFNHVDMLGSRAWDHQSQNQTQYQGQHHLAPPDLFLMYESILQVVTLFFFLCL